MMEPEKILLKIFILFCILFLILTGSKQIKIYLYNMNVSEEVVEKQSEDKVINTYQILKGKNENVLQGSGSGSVNGSESGNILWQSGETTGSYQMSINTNKQFSFYYRDKDNAILHKEIPFDFKIIEVDEDIARLDEHQLSHVSCRIKKRKDTVIEEECNTVIGDKYFILCIPKGLFENTFVTLE